MCDKYNYNNYSGNPLTNAIKIIAEGFAYIIGFGLIMGCLFGIVRFFAGDPHRDPIPQTPLKVDKIKDPVQYKLPNIDTVAPIQEYIPKARIVEE